MSTLILLSLLCGIVSVSGEFEIRITADPMRCNSYCDISGVFRRYFYCTMEEPFCCGTLHEKYCCTNGTLTIPPKWNGHYTDSCRGAGLVRSWQYLLGVLGILVLLAIVAACCCQCCAQKNDWDNNRRRRGTSNRRSCRSGTNASISTIELEQTNPAPSFFDPSHPFAFEPPDYETIPKDPPTYLELYGQNQTDSTNAAFVQEPGEPTRVNENSVSNVNTTENIQVESRSPYTAACAANPNQNQNVENQSAIEVQNGARLVAGIEGSEQIVQGEDTSRENASSLRGNIHAANIQAEEEPIAIAKNVNSCITSINTTLNIPPEIKRSQSRDQVTASRNPTMLATPGGGRVEPPSNEQNGILPDAELASQSRQFTEPAQSRPQLQFSSSGCMDI